MTEERPSADAATPSEGLLAPGSRRVWPLALEAVALLAAIGFVFALQFSCSTIVGPDGYLHIRMAEFLRDHGVDTSFEWARFSTFAETFSDKDLLFHASLIPFTFFGDLFAGAKWAAACWFSALLATVFLFLRGWGSRTLAVPFLLLLVSPYSYLFESCRPRPFAAVTIITILILHCLIQKRSKTLFLLTVAYCLLHISGPYALIFTVVVEAVRYLKEKAVCLRNPIAVVAGIVVGYLVHPYFPNNVWQFIQNAILVPVYASRGGVLELGMEFFPASSREFLLWYPFLTGGFLLCLGLCLVYRSRLSLRTAALFGVITCFYVFAFLSRRYLSHAWPLAVLFFASFAADVIRERGRRGALLCVSGVGLVALTLLALQFPRLREKIDEAEIWSRHYEEMAAVLRRSVPSGETVFHANWSDSQYLIGLCPDQRFLVTLDPVYMYAWKPELYELYRTVSYGRSPDPYRAIREGFDATHGYVSKIPFVQLTAQVRSDQRFRIIAEDQLGLLFKLQ